MLAADYEFLHFDTGSLLRAEVKPGSELGDEIASYINKGELVPLRIIKLLVRKFLSESAAPSILFDGFPRSLEQARVLADALGENGDRLDCAVYLTIDKGGLIERIVNRRFCSNCGAIYNLKTDPPAKPGVCDRDGGDLIQREDDTEEVLSRRLEVYLQETEPVLEYYEREGVLEKIDAEGQVKAVNAKILELLGLGGGGAA